jgi:HNH endonuclease
MSLTNTQIIELLKADDNKLRDRPRPKHEIYRAELLKQGKRFCPCCEEVKTLEHFTKNKNCKDGFKVYCRECQKEKRESTKEYNAEKSKEWREANPERFAERRDAWSDSHRLQENARLRVVSANRRNQMKVSIIEEVDYNEILIRDNYICHICGHVVIPSDVQFDHVVPLSRGGTHTYDNIKVSHSLCNRKKGNKLMSELVEKVTPTLKSG